MPIWTLIILLGNTSSGDNNICNNSDGWNDVGIESGCTYYCNCGNNICEAGENYENCPSDCPKPEGFTLWIMGILLVIVLIIVAYFFVMRKKKDERE